MQVLAYSNYTELKSFLTMNPQVLDYNIRYNFPSQLDGDRLLLATSAASNQLKGPHFFTGRLTSPRRTAKLLRALMSVVRTRFHIPPVMLARILAQADPVITSSEHRLRFEGFSGCCGVYARVDLLPASVDGQTFGRGTTNVDFNQPMLTALGRMKDTDHVFLHVGLDEVQLTRNMECVVEKKVPLPLRWLKGFVEVQACQSRMTLVHEVTGIEAARFLRSLPRMKTHRRETFIVGLGSGLRLSQIATSNAVRVGGLERLLVLKNIVSDALQLRVYADEITGSSAWELTFSDCRFHLVISPEVWRGFSGEGQALHSMTANTLEHILPFVREHLSWHAVIDEEVLHRGVAARYPDLAIEGTAIRGALAVLGTSGLVGFDLAEGRWFRRELPFDINSLEKQHPRLKNARRLVADGRIRLATKSPEKIELFVSSGGVEHLVRLLTEEAKCTCTWHAKHGASRGPCKHIIASLIFVEGLEDAQ